MKRSWASILMMMTLLAFLAVPAEAQGRKGKNRDCREYSGVSDRRDLNRELSRQSYVRDNRYSNDQAYRRYDDRYDDRSFLERHRDAASIVAGAGAGAIAGAMAGGTKGALIGGAVGAGGAALYTYVLRDRDEDGRYRAYDGYRGYSRLRR